MTFEGRAVKFWKRWEKQRLRVLTRLVDDESRPTRNALADVAKNVRLIELNVKAFGYDLAMRLAQDLPVRTDTVAAHVGLASKASTQADIESDWCAHWAAQLKTPVIYHRKLWELTYVLQALHEHGQLAPGTRGLGFGCGREPVASYLASQGVAVTVTDLAEEEARARGWVASDQHLDTRETVFFPHLVDRAQFDTLVDHAVADMNAIPPQLTGYDFCWSTCAMEHLGSLQHGADFVENALATLRPGGLSVHTMEYNVESDGPTIDNWVTVLFQRKHLEALAERLRAKGHHVATLDFDVGHQPMDRFIDVPPWLHDLPPEYRDRLGDPYHLKIGIDGFVSTCFGIIVTKAG
ncbi:MAG: class I SAM-dependent methyltransferase [Lysobacteraceae bacterium]|nr:MAG: class I SAM-dependent methyltransferase [Xanthomonadaceae bacterium]